MKKRSAAARTGALFDAVEPRTLPLFEGEHAPASPTPQYLEFADPPRPKKGDSRVPAVQSKRP